MSRFTVVPGNRNDRLSLGVPSIKKTPKNAHLWERDPDDWYVEPAWCDTALFAVEQFQGVVHDPCCGLGRVLDAAKAAGCETFGGDIVDRGASARHPFLLHNFIANPYVCENIAFNPPYKYDDEAVRAAVEFSVRKAAVLLRSKWANGGKRSRWLEGLPLRRVRQLAPRPSMPPGAVVLANEGEPSGGQEDFAWYIFERGYIGEPTFGWARRV